MFLDYSDLDKNKKGRIFTLIECKEELHEKQSKYSGIAFKKYLAPILVFPVPAIVISRTDLLGKSDRS